jgi:drug/metabolite transporter (DMT)-like permease
VLAKSCKPIPIMLSGVLFAHKRYPWRKYFYVLMIVFGMAIFLYNPQKSNGSNFQFSGGEFLLLLSLLMDGATGAVQDRIRHSYITDKYLYAYY